VPYTHPVTSSSLVGPTWEIITSECDEDGESWRSVKPLPSGSVGSNPTTHTRRVDRAVMYWPAKLRLPVKRYEGSIPSLSARMDSSMAERRLVKPRVESSNLSSSAGCFGRDGSIAPV
jgi:hypothetical protein